MSILYWISVIALCTRLFNGAEGQATCALSWDNGTALSDTEWSFGFALDTIEDVTAVGTVLLNMTATDISVIRSSTSGGDSGYIFMDAVLDDGRFILTLSEYFTQYEELETSSTMRQSIIFGCSVNNRTLELAQPLTDTNNHYPEFQNAPYTYELPMPFPSGFSVQLFGEISARDVDLTNTNISFTLNSTDTNSAGFSASWLSQDTSDTKLHYAQLLTTTLLTLEKSVTFQIYATDNGEPTLTSVTNITISVDEENSTPNSPVFTHPVYIADHSGLTIEEANGTLVVFNQGNVSLSDGYDSTVVYTITDNIASYEESFEITISEDYSYISITLRNVTETLLAEQYAILTLTATRTGATSTGVTILHITLPGSLICTSTTDSGTTTVEITTESTTITSDSTSVTEYTTTTENRNEATTTEIGSGTTITTTEIINETAATTTDNGSEVTTTTTDNGSETTATTTECPYVTVTQECYCTTTETEYDTTTDSSVTTTIVTPSLSFSNSIYRFEKYSTFTGVLMTQTAVTTNVEGTIVYSVSIDDEDLASRILIDSETAALEITGTISPGIYTFQIIATIEDLSITASATVVLVISTLTDCSGDIVFGYALQIIELEEESAHENILPLDDNGCNYTIYSQSPSQDLFYLNETYLNAVAIDREASYFSEMTVAQVRVIIDAICPNETDNDNATTRSKRDTEYEVLTENIAYERTRTVLVVIINDINDNAPVWNSDTPTYVGFPSYELAQLIHVPYVHQFTATDADIGDNAIVTYTSPGGSEELFYIHDSEGTLYIRKGVYAEDHSKFTIIATDGLFETSKEITVRTLESSNVVVVFIDGGVLEDIEEIIEDLSNNTGYWISSLGSAVISESDIPSTISSRTASNRSKRTTDGDTLLRLVIYGLENNEPVTSETLVLDLDEVDLTWIIYESATLEEILSNSTNSSLTSDFNTRGYWAAIIVLSVLLFVAIASAGVVYYLFCRPNKSPKITYETFENRSSNGSMGSDSVKSVTLNQSHQDHITESTDSPNGDWVTNPMKNPEKSFLEVNRTFNTIKGGNDGDLVFTSRDQTSTDTTSTPARQKSVAFNNTVEEIEVARL